MYAIICREPGCLNDGWEIVSQVPEALGRYEFVVESEKFKVATQPDMWVGGSFTKGGRWLLDANGHCIASASW